MLPYCCTLKETGQQILEGIWWMYSAEISRRNPTCFLFLLDQSASMAISMSGEQAMTKAAFLTDVVNRTLHDLVIRCAAGPNEVLNRYEVGVIGFGADVRSAFSGALAGRDLVPIDEVGPNPARLEERVKTETDDAGGVLDRPVRFPIWVDPVSGGGTAMVTALTRAQQLLETWIQAHPHAFPPTVILCTDGEATDGVPVETAQALRALATSDGHVLLFNCHISNQGGSGAIQFPATPDGLPDRYSQMLFDMSSPFPPGFAHAAADMGFNLEPEARGFVFNADPVALVHFFEIGTRAALMPPSA
jgi:hypothetical protein